MRFMLACAVAALVGGGGVYGRAAANGMAASAGRNDGSLSSVGRSSPPAAAGGSVVGASSIRHRHEEGEIEVEGRGLDEAEEPSSRILQTIATGPPMSPDGPTIIPTFSPTVSPVMAEDDGEVPAVVAPSPPLSTLSPLGAPVAVVETIAPTTGASKSPSDVSTDQSMVHSQANGATMTGAVGGRGDGLLVLLSAAATTMVAFGGCWR